MISLEIGMCTCITMRKDVGQFFVAKITDTFYFLCKLKIVSFDHTIFELNLKLHSNKLKHYQFCLKLTLYPRYCISTEYIFFPRLAKISPSLQFILQNDGGILLMKRSCR